MVSAHIIARKNSRTKKKSKNGFSTYYDKTKFEDKKVEKWFRHMKSIFIKLQENKLLTKSVLPHIMIHFKKGIICAKTIFLFIFFFVKIGIICGVIVVLYDFFNFL